MRTLNKKQHYIFINNVNIFDNTQRIMREQTPATTVIIPHVCNNIDLFDAGFAANLADRYPMTKENYHLLGRVFLKTNLGYCQMLKVDENKKNKSSIYVANMIAQNGIRNGKNIRPLNYFALMKSMYSISLFIKKYTEANNTTDKVEIHAPKFGSGLSGGNWNFIADLIEDIWKDYNVYVYSPRIPT
jgi:hypothetical protein|tara:strand:- start:11407 stop:11967 length:561 start_codon:yes stop_codon:yes gene_type:complete